MTSVAHSIRRIFFTGLLVSLPLVITIFIFKFVFELFDGLLGPVVTTAIRIMGAPIPPDFRIPGIGVVSTIAVIFFIGLVSANYLGRKLWDMAETALTKIPIIRSVYIAAKQVIDTFSTSNGAAFRKVALVEYPRKGMFSLAFITGTTRGEVAQRLGGEMVNIFIPTTPNPTSGFLLILPKEAVIELDMAVEDGVKMIVSCGLVVPPTAGAIVEGNRSAPSDEPVSNGSV
ncbi:MAG: DUF502 domain-containing protein [Nitrospinae bacterium]|nr:DUF502 domain-containing protein [Nitrospinota bacterium]